MFRTFLLILVLVFYGALFLCGALNGAEHPSKCPRPYSRPGHYVFFTWIPGQYLGQWLAYGSFKNETWFCGYSWDGK